MGEGRSERQRTHRLTVKLPVDPLQSSESMFKYPSILQEANYPALVGLYAAHVLKTEFQLLIEHSLRKIKISSYSFPIFDSAIVNLERCISESSGVPNFVLSRPVQAQLLYLARDRRKKTVFDPQL